MPESLFLKACNFIEKETMAQVFPCEFCEISKNTFFTEHLPVTAFVQLIEVVADAAKTFKLKKKHAISNSFIQK